MFLYNTLTKTKEKIIPRHPSISSGQAKIQMFVCGPTVYDYIHIGNARTFVFFDVVAKYLHSQGYEVDYIQNITDIDDKIIARAKESNRDPLEYAKEYYEKFKDDMKALGVDSPRYIPATEHIEQVIRQVKTLIDKGHAYLIEGDGYYFDLSTFKDYGKLSGRKAQMADDAVSRIDENDKKKNKGDFCLWKLSKEGPGEGSRGGTSTGIASEPSWETELGKGRPGWHIEDTAITEHFFGPQYDIHGGGQDLIFPHHEAEITQQESASGLKPFVKYWMHIAFLINKDQKMSKSVGNFETVNELLKKYPKEVLRFYLLSGYYRQPLEFSEKMLKQSEAAIQRISEFTRKLKNVATSQVDTSEEIDKYTTESKESFNKAMDNDFNTPEAFAVLFELIRKVNPIVTTSQVDTSKTLDFLEEINKSLGIIPSEEQKIPAKVQELVEKREKFREEKNYEEGDKIRTQIQDLGWGVEDTVYGPLVVKFK
jgi:cysteinyl-tRNA synthetase